MSPPRADAFEESPPPPPPSPPPGPTGSPTTAILASSSIRRGRSPAAASHATPGTDMATPPSKRHRGGSSPPSRRNREELSSPRPARGSSTPPSARAIRGGEVSSSEDDTLRSSSMPRKKLVYSPEQVKGNGIPVGIFWDMKNCSLPKDANPQHIFGHIMRALSDHRIHSSDVKFYAFRDFTFYSEEELVALRVETVQCAHNDKKEVIDKNIIVDMLCFGHENPGPACVMLISSNAVYARALRVLRKHRRHTIALAIPSDNDVESELTNAADIVWDWTSLAFGEGVGVPKCLASDDDIDELKNEISKLVPYGGSISVSKIPKAYAKRFHKPLVLCNYGCTNLDELFHNLEHYFFVKGGRVSINTPTSSLKEGKVVRTDLNDLQEDETSKDIAVPTSPTSVMDNLLGDLNINMMYGTYDVTAKEGKNFGDDMLVLETGPNTQPPSVVLETGPSTQPPPTRLLKPRQRQRPRRRVDLG